MYERKLGIVIGTNEYSDSKIHNLHFAEKDAKDVKDILLTPEICGFDEVTELINKTEKQTFYEICQLLKKAESNDLILIYFSGHGETDDQHDLCLLFNNTEWDNLIPTSLNYSMVKKCINNSKCKTVIVILDCCYSGAAGIKGNNLKGVLSNLLGSGTVVLSASSEFDVAKEDENLENGVFTHYLIKGLRGEVNGDSNGDIDLLDLYNYVYKKTTKIHSQTPYRKIEGAGKIIIGKRFCKLKEEDAGRKESELVKIEEKSYIDKLSNSIPANTYETFISPSSGIEFILIPADEFTMGSNEYDDEQPVHNVKIKKPFYLGKYLVTQKQWKTVMDDSPIDNSTSYFKGKDKPIESVSWDNVQVFIEKLNKMENTNKYRLPSEAEWEYACRAGTQTRYSFGDDASKLSDFAWYSGNSGNRTHKIGKKKCNSFGLYDMYGNVWEWVQDTYHKKYEGAPSDGSVWEDRNSTSRVIRGGSWSSNDWNCRSANRLSYNPEYYYNYVGFRLLREL